MNILVVDDEKFNLAVAKSFIENLLPDAIIITCSKPETVMDILATERVDIILLDIIMPGMTGFDLLKEVRAKHEFDDIQIIILTSITDNESFKYCFEIGADDYIRKPIDPVEFNARLKAAVKSRQNTMILKQTQYQMIQKEKLVSIGELAAGIAHEINNPIGFIGSNLETMHNFINKIHQAVEEYRKLLELIDCGNPSASDLKLRVSEIIDLEIKLKLDYVMDDLDNIISESIDGIERVAKIVQSLKVFSRSAVDNELTDNNLGVLMEDALMMVRNEAKYTIEIETEYMDTMDVFCNKGQIVQVMVNLLLNAIQAIKSKNPNCRGHLKVRTYTENGYACCSITDDGPGIPDSIRDKIFNPFFTTKAIGQGTGLGLSISLDIITKKHNGKMTFFNETSGGTTFIFMLPLNKDERVGLE